MNVANQLHSRAASIPRPNNREEINQWLESLPDILEQVVGIQTDFSRIIISAESWKNQPIEYKQLILHLQNLHEDPDLLHQPIEIQNKNLYRPLLQWLGGYLVQHIDSGIWYNELIRQAQAVRDEGYQLCVIGGLRFPADAELVCSAGGTIVSVFRPSLDETDLADPTERERRKIHVDTTVINDGTLSDLDSYAAQLVQDITQHSLRKEYGTLTT